MRLLLGTLSLSLALALSHSAPPHHADMHAGHDSAHPDAHDHQPKDDHHAAKLDRCDGIEFDAIAPDEKGITFFFKGDHLWKGFTGLSELLNNSFKELDDHHDLGHVDAAFRIHHQDKSEDHDHIFLFLASKVFSYYNHTLEEGYPKEIQQVFPGIPSHLDAAVECPSGECGADSVLFFKDGKIYHYDIKTKTVKEKEWPHLPKCTSAFRWLERYYCFHGNLFTRFHPVTGEVSEGYPKDARNYFMKCPGFGHGHSRPHFNCTDPHLDAITTDKTGKAYSFRGEWYLRLDTHRDGSHAFPIDNSWKEVHSNVDAVFSYEEKLYFIKDDQVYIYKSGRNILIEGYPKTLKEELGIDGPVNAAFACEGESIVYVIQGQKMYFVDLSATPRSVIKDAIIPISNVEAGTCDSHGVRVFVGSQFYYYDSPAILAFSKMQPHPQETPKQILGCDHPDTTAHSGSQ